MPRCLRRLLRASYFKAGTTPPAASPKRSAANPRCKPASNGTTANGAAGRAPRHWSEGSPRKGCCPTVMPAARGAWGALPAPIAHQPSALQRRALLPAAPPHAQPQEQFPPCGAPPPASFTEKKGECQHASGPLPFGVGQCVQVPRQRGSCTPLSHCGPPESTRGFPAVLPQPSSFSSSQEPRALGALPSTASTRPPQRSRSSSSPHTEGLKAAPCLPPQCCQQPGADTHRPLLSSFGRRVPVSPGLGLCHSPVQAVLQHRGHRSCPAQLPQPHVAQLRTQGSPPVGTAQPRFLSPSELPPPEAAHLLARLPGYSPQHGIGCGR